MKTPITRLTTLGCFFALTLPALGQARFTGYEFTSSGTFAMTISGRTEVDVSTNLQTWTRFNAPTEETVLDDQASRKLDWRFYRLRGGAASGTNVIGYVKVTVAPRQTAFLGNPFSAPLSLNSAEQRMEVFGTTNPPVKLSLFAAGGFQPHTWDRTTGKWTPALRTLRPQEGFTVENVGTEPLLVRFSGQVRQGQFNLVVPAGTALMVPPIPQPGPIPEILGIPAKDGMQLDVFNEATQQHQISTFDSLDKAWTPKPPEYRPGRCFIVKSPEALTWTKSYSSHLR